MKKVHPFSPVYNQWSHILILGSLPSIASVERGFYYMHPQNRFWKVLSKIYEEDAYSMDIQGKTDFILKHHLALYDVVFFCDIKNSSDASIENVVCTDIEEILKDSSIERILLNGNKAYTLFCKAYPQLKDIALPLPSTSSANARVSLDELSRVWEDALLKRNILI
ncbi:MAG: DNA-deoxyinosine glycosylase [Roseburia sp.]|nr:DNA-deoxyinosine glycosylase [Anaeroplasma bactoclasticum]MCM1196509.1 DNA-deoxyinosine glycosylase [Roseburia sp.]MCM1556431.1 DNA-deoxyinosine glycosylase [Anaeroplasma bactoclasticum]